MQSMQRQFNRLRTKGPGDNAKVSVLLSDYDDVDKVLVKVGRSASPMYCFFPQTSFSPE